MKYDTNATGTINKGDFAKAYARKMLRDAADGKRSAFVPLKFSLMNSRHPDSCADYRILSVSRNGHRIDLGCYAPRKILQKHRYQLWQSNPEALSRFFDLDFNAYCAFFGINDHGDQVLARLRW